MSVVDDLPTEADLRRLTRRKLVAVVIGLVLAALVAGGLHVVLDGVRLPTVLSLVALALILGNALTLTGLPLKQMREFRRREVQAAGTRRRRRRLRWALLRGRASDLDQHDRRACLDLARVVCVRVWTLLLVNGTTLPGMTALLAGSMIRTPPPQWLAVLVVVGAVLAVAELALAAWEMRAARRFLAEAPA